MSKGFFNSGDWTGRGKMEDPSKRFICECGDPNCVYSGGKSPGGEGFTATGIDPRGNDMNNRREEEEVRRQYEVMRRAMISGRNPFAGDYQQIPREPSGPPSSYTEARSKVEKYILTNEYSVEWDDVIGNTAAKEALIEAIEAPVKEADLYAFYGMKPPKGVLLYGPPGCGKTMFAKASASAMSRLHGKKVDIIAISGPEIQSPYVGVTEGTIKALFTYAREYLAYHGHPLILFIDECETLLPDRTGRTRRVAPWEESQVAQFLSELDGMDKLGAFVILATNRPEAIDEALLRDGRCDRKIKVERPSRLAVEHILRNSLRGIPTNEDLDHLVMAGAESFFNPHYVIHEGSIIIERMEMKAGAQPERMKEIATNFLLEHIVSGALVAGVAHRVKSRAFRRDKASGTRGGATTQDVLDAVKEIYEENKSLEHEFAMREWSEGLEEGAKALMEKEINKHGGSIQ